ncbi:MAG: hypothetical protein K0S60_860 [Evtepia sp.]|jgi:hypothetical protein|nr:hypothetical protein [Evtepia sp.]
MNLTGALIPMSFWQIYKVSMITIREIYFNREGVGYRMVEEIEI